MSIFINKDTKLVVQGITGRDGSFHAKQMIEYGTQVVAGVTPGKGGQKFENTVPIFNTVADAVKETGANTSVIYVPPAFAADAIMEAAASGVAFVVCITEGVPVLDMTRVYPFVKERGVRLLGPNCPGLISPGQSKVGIVPGRICTPGPVGVVSRSGTLTYEVVYQLTRAGIGQTTCVGIGGDPINGTNFIDCLEAFEKDPATKAIAMMGEIGGTDEQEAAEYVRTKMKKPVVGFIAGQTAPPGRRMGHAGAIISGGTGAASDKMGKQKVVYTMFALSALTCALLLPGTSDFWRVLAGICVVGFCYGGYLALMPSLLADTNLFLWVDLEACSEEETRRILEGVFHFHPLSIDDCINVSPSPKVDEYVPKEDDVFNPYLFVVIHGVDYHRKDRIFATSELDLFIGKNFLVTYHTVPLRSITATEERCLKSTVHVARAPDRLAHALLDQLVDNYKPSLDELSIGIGELETEVLQNPSVETMNRILEIKKEVHHLRQIIGPQRELLSRFAREIGRAHV